MKARNFFIETYGCQMNDHDSEKISGILCHRGMVPVRSVKEADLVIINTCSIREKAAQKVYSRLGEIRKKKGERKDFLIGVVGCVAQQEGTEMALKAPFIDMIVGTHLYHTIPDLLDDIELSQESTCEETHVNTTFLEDVAPVEMISPTTRNSSFRANITIMEGCNKHCSFCIVPFTRGKERNRRATHIFDEAKKAIDEGYVEILLLGQTVNAYRDPTMARYRFSNLLYDLASIKGLKRLRFTSPHPREFNDETVAVISESNVICNQIHLPLQSGSNRVLKRMRRQYTREKFLQIIEKFNACSRPVAFSTDIIVGFPGEDEKDFEETIQLIKIVKFESMFSFKYSERPKTEASFWKDTVPEIVKSQRLTNLQLLQKRIQLKLNKKRYLGKRFPVLVEGKARDGINLFGRTTTNRVVNFLSDKEPGSLVNIRVKSIGPNSLKGEQV